MKCPNCGHWNRASFPRCFRCGTPLNQGQPDQADWQSQLTDNPAEKSYLRADEEGSLIDSVDERDKLAAEMERFVERKMRGEDMQRQLREQSSAQGIAPSGRTVQSLRGRSDFFTKPQRISYESDADIEGDVRPDAIRVVPQQVIDYGEFGDERMDAAARRRRSMNLTQRNMHLPRIHGKWRIIRLLALVFACVSIAYIGYRYALVPYVLDKREPSLQETTSITPSILDDKAAHTIRIPGEEGSTIYIMKLGDQIVTGGYATFEVPDYLWYEDEQSVTAETAEAVLQPYLRTGYGEQKPLGVIRYTVDIPLSPLILVSPDVEYLEVPSGKSVYNIQILVEKNSTVYINGENLTDLVNTQDGLISYNATVQPIGENTFTIVTRCQYYRENSKTITLYRKPQQIQLDFASDLAPRHETNEMSITATTLAQAHVKVITPHKNFDDTLLASTGTFSFVAIFDKIGTNTITIEVSYPGKETSTYDLDVYYLPFAIDYTRKAWGMDNYGYSDFLNNATTRINNTQIYECVGEIIEIMADKPQLAIMETSKVEGVSRTILIENLSTDTWVLGQRYRVYADAYGMYNGMPRLIARYTYAPRASD